MTALLALLLLLDVTRYVASDLLVCLGVLRARLRPPPPPAPPPADAPLVSIILAGYNEERTIPLTLASLREQDYPRFEVIVVDDGSTDGTHAAVEAFLARAGLRGDPRWRLVRLQRRNGKAGALNLGLLLSRGDLVVYVDADTTFECDAITTITRPLLADPTLGGVGGNLVVRNRAEGLLARVVDLEYLLSIEMGRRFRARLGLLHVISGAFGAFRRDLLLAVGGHTPTSGNDGDLTLKIRRLARVDFVPEARCFTKSPARLQALVRQRRRWDRNMIKNKLRRHLDLLDPRSARFRLSNALLVLDGLFFNVLLSLRWVAVGALTLLSDPALLPAALAAAYVVYLGLGTAQLAMAHYVRPLSARDRLGHWLVLPLFPLYKTAFRLVRLYAYTEELWRYASYRDAFAPAHVSVETLGYDRRAPFRPRDLALALLWPFAYRTSTASPK